MSAKAELAKLKKQRTADELENLFNQFEEQVQIFEKRITTIKKSIEEFEAKKSPDENDAEEEGEAPAKDVISQAPPASDDVKGTDKPSI